MVPRTASNVRVETTFQVIQACATIFFQGCVLAFFPPLPTSLAQSKPVSYFVHHPSDAHSFTICSTWIHQRTNFSWQYISDVIRQYLRFSLLMPHTSNISSVYQYVFALHRLLTLRKVEVYKPGPVPPEVRMVTAKWASPIYMASFFWFA